MYLVYLPSNVLGIKVRGDTGGGLGGAIAPPEIFSELRVFDFPI